MKTQKTMISISLFFLIISLFQVFSLSSNPVSAQTTGTQVSGIISTNTTWTKANSPYNFTGNILINNGITLTIESGVTVNLNNFYIMVNGTLHAIGDKDNKIVFSSGQITFTQFSTAWNESNSKGCIIENSFINSALTIMNSVKIDYDTIYGLITITQAKIEPPISNNIITGGIFCYYNTRANISNNIIMNSPILIGASYDSNITVCGNIISGADSGIRCTTGGLGVDSIFGLIENNLIVNNTNGIYLRNYGGPLHITIRNNTITNNNIGILSQLDQAVFYNNIYGNTNYNILHEDHYGFNASYNWWGTTNLTTISKSIYDFKNDSKLGNVTYTPFLTTPNTQAPTYINATSDSGGSISPSGVVKLNYGDNQSFAITPNTGYYVSDVLINGTSIGAVNSYTVQSIGGATTVSATFTTNPNPTPTPVITEFPSTVLMITLIIATTVIGIISFNRKQLRT
jgi:hypothetical protein